MKNYNKTLYIIVLFFLLLISIVLNIRQELQIKRLGEQIEYLEYLQTVLSDHIADLESDTNTYGNEAR